MPGKTARAPINPALCRNDNTIFNQKPMSKQKNKKPIAKTKAKLKQQKQPTVTQTKKQKSSQKVRGVPRMIIGIISFVIGVAGFLFLVYPRISVYPGTSLNLRNPFQTPFMIKNDGYLPLYSIKYSLIAEKMELVNGSTFTNSGGTTGNIIGKLSPNKSSALFMNRIFSMPPDSVKYAHIFVHVTYKPYLVPFTFTESIRFKTERKTNGEYVWFESYDKQ